MMVSLQLQHQSGDASFLSVTFCRSISFNSSATYTANNNLDYLDHFDYFCLRRSVRLSQGADSQFNMFDLLCYRHSMINCI